MILLLFLAGISLPWCYCIQNVQYRNPNTLQESHLVIMYFLILLDILQAWFRKCLPEICFMRFMCLNLKVFDYLSYVHS